jgi:hypothetical protein
VFSISSKNRICNAIEADEQYNEKQDKKYFIPVCYVTRRSTAPEIRQVFISKNQNWRGVYKIPLGNLYHSRGSKKGNIYVICRRNPTRK